MTPRPSNDDAQPKKAFRIGWLADLEWLARNAGRIKEVRDSVGVDTIWLESGLFHTAGFRLSDDVWSTSPVRDWRERPGLTRHREVRRLPESAFPVLPGVLAGADDTALLTVLEVAHRLDIEVWGHVGLWSYGATLYPELAVRDIWGAPIAPKEDIWGACFCPSKPNLNRWVADCLCEVVQRYPVDGLEVDHARYAPPPSLPNLLTCACPECRQQGLTWGVDLQQLAKKLCDGLSRVKTAPAASVELALEKAGSIPEALELVMSDSVATVWFEVRARLVSVALGQLAAATHEAARRPLAFGIDVFPPSVALLGGHAYEALSDLDYLTGGFGAIGWGSVGLSTCRELARFLCGHWPELDEGLVLRSLYRMLGYGGLALPEEICRLERPDGAAWSGVAVREIERMAHCRPPGTVVYPPVSLSASGDEGLRMVCRSVVEHGLDGVMVAGLEKASVRQERIIAESLGYGRR